MDKFTKGPWFGGAQPEETGMRSPVSGEVAPNSGMINDFYNFPIKTNQLEKKDLKWI